MRFSLLAALCLTLLISISSHLSAASVVILDPNADGAITAKVYAQTDPRLAQKVTYEAKFQSVQQILDDLREITGVKLIAGYRDSDWPVRSRMMNIFVHDVPLSDLMDSIARTMKFRWSRYDNVKPLMYRLKVDSKAAAEADAMMKRAEKKKEAIWQKRRTEWIDAIDKYGSQSSSELESLRQDNPVAYRYARYGAIQALHALFDEVPETKERFAAGRSFRISADDLSPQLKRLMYAAGEGYWEYLQISSQVDRQPDGSLGYGNVLQFDDGFDVAYYRMDETEGFTPGRRWGEPAASAGYFHLMRNKDGQDLEMADLRAINENWSRVACEVNNYILDGEPMPSDMGIRYDNAQAELVNQEESLYPSETLNEHSNFDELEKRIKLNVETLKTDQSPEMVTNSYIASFQKALSKATGLSIVSDSWVNIQGEMLPDQELSLEDILDKFSQNYNYNWDKTDSILEFRHRKWAKMRLNQIPSEWVARWNQNTQDNGYLSLEAIAEIANLTYDQAEESIKIDKVLGATGLYDELLGILDANGNLIWLRLYSSLTARQRLVLMNNYGLNGFMLTSAQWKLALPMFDRIGISRGEALMHLVYTIDKDTNTFNASFKEIDLDSDVLDRIWNIDLPTYTSPAKEAQQ